MQTGRVISFSFDAIGFILSMIFMVLKLCGVITWSWVIVFLPLIIAAGLMVLIILIIATVFILTLIIGLNS